MAKHKQFISEWKSINHAVDKVSRYVAHMIWEDSSDKMLSMSKMHYEPLLHGEFSVDVDSLFEGDNLFGVSQINVKYILYMVDRYEEYSRVANKISKFDKDTNTITITCVAINGEIHPEFVSDIYHELEHCFQYGKGMLKREDLYSRVVDIIQSTSDELEEAMARLLYYTFPHEQDAFANEFYAFLMSNKPTEEFEYLMAQYSQYRSYYMSLLRYKRLSVERSKDVRTILDGFGMTPEQFNKRIHYGGRRLKKKLNSVYERYRFMTRNMTVESIVKNDSSDMWFLAEARKKFGNIDFIDEYVL